MEHLDLAGIMTTPPQWNLPVFDQQDAIYLSSSRQMLEPIMEETSEDEEYALNSWQQYDGQLSDSGEGGNESTCSASCGGRATAGGASFWSSAESETGSVIRVEITKDNDSNSERDFLCPAKRARRCEEPAPATAISNAAEDEVTLRRPLFGDMKNSSLERFLNYENFTRDSWGTNSQQRSSLGSRRGGAFDDFYSDSDSLSYNSLSRSSSLVQFESLERQLLLQEQHASMNSLGNSSPSLLSFDTQAAEESVNKTSSNSVNNSGNSSRRGSQSSLLKKYESLDGRLHQTYYDLDKLNFDDMEASNSEAFGRAANLKLTTHLAELRSDSESSSEGSDGSSRPQSVLSPTDSVDNEFSKKFQRVNSQQSKKGKSSAENLSEDSGYCEPLMGFGLRRSKSQNLCKNYEKFSEEDEELMEHKSIATAAALNSHQVAARSQMFIELNGDEETDEKKAKHSNNSSDFKNTSTRHHHNHLPQQQQQQQTPPTSPLLDYMRHKQRNATHSPSPVSSEVSTSSTTSSKHSNSSANSAASSATTSSCSSASSTTSSSSSATTCASKASFTWLMPSTTSAAANTRAYDRQENPLRISLNDLRDGNTSNGNNNVVNDDDRASPKSHHGKQVKTLLENAPSERGQENSLDPANASEEQQIVNEVENLCENCYSVLEYVRKNNEYSFLKCENCQNCAKVHECPNTFNAQTIEEEKLRHKISEQQKDLETDFEQHCIHKETLENLENFDIRNARVFNSPSIASNSTEREQAREPRVQTEICLSKTLAAQLSSDSDYSPQGIRRSFINLMQNWPERTSSVPNELNKLGRKKKFKRSRPKHCVNAKNELLTDTATSSDEIEEDLVCSPLAELKRSASWCFETRPNHLSNLTATEFPHSITSPPQETKHLGLLHQSYHNLALLELDSNPLDKMSEHRISSDYETDIVCKSNFLLDELSAHYDKTASILNDQTMDETDHKIVAPKPKPPSRRRKSSNSSYSESENTDEEHVQHVQLVIRKPPARQKRQQHDQEKSNSLTQDYSFAAIMQGKTFDQDPTMLRTSYAQSLEKCNFDCREISNQDLTRTRTIPKRRFHSQAAGTKKKNLVSSTPNLNAYQQDEEEIEDDIFVSSAHTSMHQLPMGQQQKPLGILLPAGSRTSFSKEVSFCPVVSKYSWQEQSSEEQHEESENVENMPTVLPGAAGSEESDDELLDNCDAVVLKNTKENENIGNLYKDDDEMDTTSYTVPLTAEHLMKEKYMAVIKELPTVIRSEELEIEREQQPSKETTSESELETKQREELRAQRNKVAFETTHKENDKESELSNALQEHDDDDETHDSETDCELPTVITTARFSLTTNVNNETLAGKPDTCSSSSTLTQVQSIQTKEHQQQRVKPTIIIARPISIQLPILSEPPINRAHHILYASQQMLDNFQKHQENENYEHCNKSQSVQNLDRMSSDSRGKVNSGGASSAVGVKINNNNEVMKSKFKADEKHPNSKGFLSRLSSGFRFSMRRNKKKLQKENNGQQQLQQPAVEQQQQTQPQQQQQQQLNSQSSSKKSNGLSGKASKSSSSKQQNSQSGNKNQPDYIYIPLKGPLPEKYETGYFSHNNGNAAEAANVATPAATNGNAANEPKFATVQKKGAKHNKTKEEQKVTGKPPIPPQQQQQQQQYLQKIQSAQSAPQPGSSSSQPQQQQIQVGLSRFYTEELSSGSPSVNNNNNTAPDGATAVSTEDFLASERYHSNSQQQSFANDAANTNNMTTAAVNYEFVASPSRATVSQKTQMFNNLSSRNSAVEPKIGLIETNLDTHETVITGKTRSLINIGPNQSAYAGGSKRLHHHHATAGGNSAVDGSDYYDDNDDDEVVVRPDGSVVVIKNNGANGAASSQAQIASVRRPHKSMEFLLDKENQKDVMVCTQIKS